MCAGCLLSFAPPLFENPGSAHGWSFILCVFSMSEDFWALSPKICHQWQFFIGSGAVVTFKRSLIIDDKSWPHKLWRSFTRLLIFKIKFPSESLIRWLTGSAEMTPVIGNAQGVHGEVTLTFELIDKIMSTQANHRLWTPRCSWIACKPYEILEFQSSTKFKDC